MAAIRGWHPHSHQLDMLARAEAPCTWLIAPTDGGKTMAGFLPSLMDLSETDYEGLHIHYISPFMALVADINAIYAPQ